MVIYIAGFIFNMLLGLFMVPTNISESSMNQKVIRRVDRRKKLYLFITTMQLGLLAGFRADKMAYDTAAYRTIFNNTPDTWSSLFENNQYIETGFSVFCSIIKILGGSFQQMLIISSLFVMASCCIFIYRHSKDVVMSVFIILSFPFFYSTFDIIRHFMAISFVLLGYKYIVNQQFLRYALFIIAGSAFHTVALAFLPLYFIGKIKYNFITLFTGTIATILCFLYLDRLAIFVSVLLGKSSGLESGWVSSYGGGIKTAIMYLVILLIAWLLFQQLKDKEVEDSISMNFVLLLFICSVIFVNARIMTRFIMAGIPYLAIAMPRLLDKTRSGFRSNRDICYVGFVIIGLLYHAFMLSVNWQNVVPYIPFWA